ncbi:MAG: flippase-like domain-containing protein [Candidatus Bathyarchaeota archaeon]|nr:flippase-like domain-containing protein [Candidatus Bathyarchaeota archaeon]
MQPPKPKLSWKTVLFPLLGLVGFFLYIYLFKVDILGIFATAQSANPLLFFLAVACGLLEILFFTISWYALTNHLNIKMTLKKAYLYVWYGIYVDIIVPAESISGEITRAYLLTRDQCGSFGKVIASLFTHRLLGMTMNVIILIAGVVWLSLEGQVSPIVLNLIIFISASITAITIVMTLLSFKKNWTLKIIDWTTNLTTKLSRGKWKMGKLKDQAVEITTHFHDSMIEFRHNPKPLTTSLFYLAITWFFSVSVPYLIFQSLGHPVSWSIILITSAIVLAVKSIPVGIPFEVGIPEAAMTTLYFSMGIPAAISATATILTRIITLWFRFFIGFGAQQWLELKPVIAQTADTEKTKSIWSPK